MVLCTARKTHLILKKKTKTKNKKQKKNTTKLSGNMTSILAKA
jgi:hypothetical protein